MLATYSKPRMSTLAAAVLSVGAVVGSFGVGLIHHPRRVYLVAAALAFGVGLTAAALAPDVPLECVALGVRATRISGSPPDVLRQLYNAESWDFTTPPHLDSIFER